MPSHCNTDETLAARFVQTDDEFQIMKIFRYFGYLGLFAGRFILFPVYWLCGFLPRSDKLWVFGSWGGYRFADNGAAFYLYCCEQLGSEFDLVWITRKRSIVERIRSHGHSAHLAWSPRGILACVRAGFHIYDCYPKDINFWLSRGSKRISLWSGVPLKVIQRDHDNPANRHYRLFHGYPPEKFLLGMMMPWHVVRPDTIVAPSEETARITGRAFDVPSDHVALTGYPRNDSLFDLRRSVSALNQPLPQSFIEAGRDGRKRFLYLPTFRDSGKDYMKMDWERLEALMENENATFFFKTHPQDRLDQGVSSPHVRELPQEIDIYDILREVDVLISDYSSVIFDFMMLDRPIIYYTPDLREFIEGSRSFNFHPRDVAVGPICETFDELIDELEKALQGRLEDFSNKRKEVFPRLNKFQDGHSSARVLSHIENRYFENRETHSRARDVDTSRAETDAR